MIEAFRLCPNAPHGPRDCGMVAVQVVDGARWTCTACYDDNGGEVRERSAPTRKHGQAEDDNGGAGSVASLVRSDVSRRSFTTP